MEVCLSECLELFTLRRVCSLIPLSDGDAYGGAHAEVVHRGKAVLAHVRALHEGVCEFPPEQQRLLSGRHAQRLIRVPWAENAVVLSAWAGQDRHVAVDGSAVSSAAAW